MKGALEKFNSKIISGWISFESGDVENILYSFNDEEFLPLILVEGERKDIKASHYVFKIPPLSDMDSDYMLYIKNSNGDNILGTPKVIVCNSHEKNKVLFGKDGWLFLNNDNNHSLGYIVGDKKLPQRILDEWIVTTKTRKQNASKLGCSIFSMIVPEKTTVYSDYLPDALLVSKDRPMCMFKQDNDLSTYYIPDFNLQNIQHSDFLYYKGDSHWNYFGAYYAFLNVIKLLGLDESKIKELKNYNINYSYMSGDLRSKIEGVNIELVKHLSSKSKTVKLIEANQKKTTGRVEVYENIAANESKRIIVFHTSSIDWMKPYFLDFFRNIKFIWSKNIDWNLVSEYEADVVLYQTNERFLVTSPDDVGLTSSLIQADHSACFYDLVIGGCFDSLYPIDKLSYFNEINYKKSSLKIILKAKDEPELIESWIEHHEKIVGRSNIIIIDSGSDNKKYLEILDKYKNDIVMLSYKKHYDLIHSPQAPCNQRFYDAIKKTCRFISILDADEFLFFSNDGQLSYSFNEKNFSESEIICGTWLNNKSLPIISEDGSVDLSKSISFYVEPRMIDHGTINGKSIIPTGLLSRVDHLGHNMVSDKCLEYISDESFGRSIVLHLSNLGDFLTKRRVAAHFSKVGMTNEDLKLFNSEVELLEHLERQVKDLPKRYENYAAQFFQRSLIKPGSSIEINIKESAVLDGEKNNIFEYLKSRNFLNIIKR